MVQLKVQYLCIGRADTVISIPYGSIKSNVPTPQNALTVKFQFLMVQLKAVH